jgi:hypothetical protein
MSARAMRCSGSLSRGAALTRIVILVVAAVVLFFAVRGCFPSREERLWKFIDAGREALADKREDDFLAAFDPAVKYRTTGGLADIRRDFKRYAEAGLGQVSVTKQHATFDATGADISLDVVFVAGLRPIAQASVTMRAEDGDGAWRVTSLGWR